MLHVISFAPIRKVWSVFFTAFASKKLTNAQWHYVHISNTKYPECHPYRTTREQSTDRKAFIPVTEVWLWPHRLSWKSRLLTQLFVNNSYMKLHKNVKKVQYVILDHRRTEERKSSPYKEFLYVTRKENLTICISLCTFINPLETKLVCIMYVSRFTSHLKENNKHIH